MSFLDELRGDVLTEDGEKALQRKYKEYIENEVLPYWVEREYAKIKEEIANRAKLGDFKNENGKKVIEGQFSFWGFGRRDRLSLSQYIECGDREDILVNDLLLEIADRGIKDFGEDFECMARADLNISSSYTGKKDVSGYIHFKFSV